MRTSAGSNSDTRTSWRSRSAIVCSVSSVCARASASRGDSSRTRLTARCSRHSIVAATSYSFECPRVLIFATGIPSFCHCQIVTSDTPCSSESSV